MVAKNNYFWTEKEKEMDFIANGEMRSAPRAPYAGAVWFPLCDVTLVFPDYNDFELEVNMLLDTLHTDSPALPKAENDRLFYSVLEDYADITVRRYDNCLKYLMELVKRDYKVDDMLLREVNGELVRKFDLYLKTEKHCAQNTVIRYMKCFKKVINLAIANEWLTKNPFAGIKFHEVEVNKQFLSQAEINRIWQKEFRIERLVLVRDVFIFCVYTGLAFIDVYNLRPEHISEDSNGNQ